MSSVKNMTPAQRAQAVKNQAAKDAAAKAQAAAPAPAPAKEKKGPSPADVARAKRQARVSFLTTEAAKPFLTTEADGTAKLTAVPTGFDQTKHLPLTKDNFADEGVFLQWRAAFFEERGHRLLRLAEKIRRDAATVAKYGTPEKRKQIKRAQKLADQLAELRKTLAAEGIDLSDLDVSAQDGSEDDAMNDETLG